MKVENSRTKNLLKFLALGSGILILSILSPTLPSRLLAAYLRHNKFQRGRFLSDLRRLQARHLINFKERADGSIKIILKRRGQEVVLNYKLKELQIKKPKHWDRKWRIVMFDIPHSKRRARDAFRAKLKSLGFYQLQKSVFIYPFKCEDEIDFICEILDIRQHVLFLTIGAFEGSEKLEHHFGLRES